LLYLESGHSTFGSSSSKGEIWRIGVEKLEKHYLEIVLAAVGETLGDTLMI